MQNGGARLEGQEAEARLGRAGPPWLPEAATSHRAEGWNWFDGLQQKHEGSTGWNHCHTKTSRELLESIGRTSKTVRKRGCQDGRR